jgi:Protein tyrosine and serine/threonine kinase
MEHLAMEGFIHRDLAARNVMLKQFSADDPNQV